jgi:hypothetical protein
VVLKHNEPGPKGPMPHGKGLRPKAFEITKCFSKLQVKLSSTYWLKGFPEMHRSLFLNSKQASICRFSKMFVKI